MQLRIVSKEEAHKLIDATPGDTVFIVQCNNMLGISNCGKLVKKRRSKKYVDQSSVVVLSQDKPITILNLHKKYFTDFTDYDKKENTKMIMIPQLE